MRVNDDYREWNAEQQITDPNSVFVYWQNILKLRKYQKNIFVYGGFEMVDTEHESIFAYRRSYESSSATVVLNFSKTEAKWVAPDRVLESLVRGDLILHTHPQKGRIEASEELLLRPFEALVWVHGSYV
jgi:glycosidase